MSGKAHNKTKNTRFIASLFRFLTLAEKLKCVERDNLLSNGKLESVASHCWMLGLMAMLLAPKMKRKVNMERALKMIIAHDIAEAITGDLPLWKALKYPKLKENKKKEEARAMAKMKKIIPAEAARELLALCDEYEANKTPEAKFVKGLDKMEAIFQANVFHDIRYWGKMYDDIYYTCVLDKDERREQYFKHDPLMVEISSFFKELTEKRMRKAGLDPEKYRTKTAKK